MRPPDPAGGDLWKEWQLIVGADSNQVFFFCAPWTFAATPAPVDKLERNGKEAEKEEAEGELPSDTEKVKEKEKDEGKEVDGNRTADPEEVGPCAPTREHLHDVLFISQFMHFIILSRCCNSAKHRSAFTKRFKAL